MSNEYKLSYTASEIDAKLKEIGEHNSSITNLSDNIGDLLKLSTYGTTIADIIEKIVSDNNFDELEMLVEANIIDILSDNNNTILTDNDGKIYVL